MLVVQRAVWPALLHEYVRFVGRAGAAANLAEDRHVAPHDGARRMDLRPVMLGGDADVPQVSVEGLPWHGCLFQSSDTVECDCKFITDLATTSTTSVFLVVMEPLLCGPPSQQADTAGEADDAVTIMHTTDTLERGLVLVTGTDSEDRQ